MILQQRFQEAPAPLRAKQERVRARPEPAPRRVGGREQRPAAEGHVVQLLPQPGDLEGQGQRAECVGEELEDLRRGGGRDQQGIDDVNDPIAGLHVEGVDEVGFEVERRAGEGQERDRRADAQALGVGGGGEGEVGGEGTVVGEVVGGPAAGEDVVSQ